MRIKDERKATGASRSSALSRCWQRPRFSPSRPPAPRGRDAFDEKSAGAILRRVRRQRDALQRGMARSAEETASRPTRSFRAPWPGQAFGLVLFKSGTAFTQRLGERASAASLKRASPQFDQRPFPLAPETVLADPDSREAGGRASSLPAPYVNATPRRANEFLEEGWSATTRRLWNCRSPIFDSLHGAQAVASLLGARSPRPLWLTGEGREAPGSI